MYQRTTIANERKQCKRKYKLNDVPWQIDKTCQRAWLPNGKSQCRKVIKKLCIYEKKLEDKLDDLYERYLILTNLPLCEGGSYASIASPMTSLSTEVLIF